MRHLVLLGAVSGAGKSFGLKDIASEDAQVIELDRMIERLYVALAVCGPFDDAYHYDN